MNELSSSDYEIIINALGRILQKKLIMRDAESSRPQRDPDASDFYIRTVEDQIAELRRLRERFEDCMTTSLTEEP